jgi:hypothetical protein
VSETATRFDIAGRARSTGAQSIELASFPFRRATGGAVPDKHRRVLCPWRRWQAVVGHALGSERGPHSSVDDPGDLEDSFPAPHASDDPVAHADRRRRPGGLPVHPDMAAPVSVGRRRASLELPHGPQPAIDSRGLHAAIVAPPSAAITLVLGAPLVGAAHGPGISTNLPNPPCQDGWISGSSASG